MSGRPLLAITLPVLTVLAICLYLRRRGRSDSDPPEPSPPDPPAAAEPTRATQPAAEEEAAAAAPPAVEQTAGRDLGQVTAWVRDNIETRAEPEPEPAAVLAESVAAVSAAAPPAAVRDESVCLQEETPQPAMVGADGDVLREVEAAVQPAQTAEQDRGDRQQSKETSAVQEEVQAAGKAPAAAEEIEEATDKTELTKEASPVVETEVPATSAEAPLTSAGPPAAEEESHVPEGQPAAATSAEETAVAAATPGPEGAAEASESATNGADTASENSSDSGKGGSSASLEQASPSSSPESVPLQTTVYDFLIPQKLCGRLIGKNGTFVNMLKARTGAHVIIRLHPVKSSVKICSVDGTQTEIDACLKMIREKFPVNKFPAMTLEQLNRPTDQPLAVPDSQQLHLPQGVTCDVLVSAVVSAGQLFLQQHTHPTFRGLERLTTLMAACYADGGSTPELPRPVVASSICAAPVAGGWYRAQVVAFYPDSDELDVRFMDFGGYSRIPAAHARQIRTDFMSLPFQAEECYLANVMPVSEDGWNLEAGAVFESLITDRALEAMVVGYAEDGTPFVNLYSIQGTEYGNSAISLVNQQLVESGAARWVESQA